MTLSERNKGNQYAKKHGMYNTRIHRIWHSMYCRCYYAGTNKYNNYGGKGIKVCEEWKHTQGFINFYNWAMGNGYDESLTLDRIDNDGNYEPQNCRWVTPKQQGRNKSNNVFYEFNGETKTGSQWCEEYGVSYTTFKDRLQRGWTIEQALTITTKGMHQKVFKS